MVYKNTFYLTVSGQEIEAGQLIDKLYNIRIAKLDSSRSWHQQELESIRANVEALVNNSCRTCKWYGSTEDMKLLSAAYPDHWFRLVGDGEDVEDHWQAVFHQGKGFQYSEDTVFKWMAEKLSVKHQDLFDDFILSNLKL